MLPLQSLLQRLLSTRSGQQTPLAYAVRSQCRKVVEILLQAGADPHACFDFAPDDLHSLMEEYRVTRLFSTSFKS